MNSPDGPDSKTEMTRAMRQLAEVAGPADLSDAALRGARGLRWRRAVLGGVAAIAAMAAMTAPILLWDKSAGDSPGGVSPGFAAPAPGLGECQDAPMVNPSTKEVAEEHWPQYLRMVLNLLPDRDDYVVQNTHDLCNWGEAGLSNAYTVINLGHHREFGHLTVNLYVHETADWVPNTCADLNMHLARDYTILFCEEGTATQPLLYGTAYSTTNITVGAVYADRRAVVMERNGQEAIPAISVDDLKLVVSNQDLLGLIPVSAGPLPAKPGSALGVEATQIAPGVEATRTAQ